MGKPTWGNAHVLPDEYIVWWREPGELKHLSTQRKRYDFPSSGERKGSSPNQRKLGLWARQKALKRSRMVLEKPARDGDSPVDVRESVGLVPEYHGAR